MQQDLALNPRALAAKIDHTNLKADAPEKDIRVLCDEALQYKFASVMVNPSYVAVCRDLLGNSGVLAGTVVGFPLGQATIKTKVFECADAIENGADEIDYVLNVAKLRDGDTGYIRQEMQEITEICHKHKTAVKVIFENCYLRKEQIRAAAEIAREIKPDFIKTSTGFGTYGAREEDVCLMKETVGELVKVKAAGGIRTLDDCIRMIAAGAERIGASSGVLLIQALG